MKLLRRIITYIILPCCLILLIAMIYFPPFYFNTYQPVPFAIHWNMDETEKININTADIDELMLLPGIGEVKAKAIIEYRQKVGKFTKLEQLLEVKGIGETMLSEMKDMVCI